jgi:ubiquinone/menaquinone biosynthesis C-methylase UbiE
MNQTDLERYASQYDNLIRYKPSYHQVLSESINALQKRLGDKKEYIIGDFGAGTGNLTERLAMAYSNSKIIALEFNDGFLYQLKRKTSKYSNVSIIKANIEESPIQKNSLDAIVMTHVLRLTKNADKGIALKNAYNQLRSGGYLVIADIGRRLNTKKHAQEILTTAYNQVGLFGLARLYFENLESIRFNKKCSRMEEKLTAHMLHSLEEFEKRIERIGFNILESRDDLYLGDDDFVVAQKH